MKGVVIASVILLILIFSGITLANNQSPICVSGKIESIGNGQYISQIDIDISTFNKPSSFIIISDLTQGKYVSSSPSFLFTQNKSGQASWLFGQSFLSVKDSQINYTFSSPDLSKHKVYLISGIIPGNPEAGYETIEIKEDKQCL